MLLRRAHVFFVATVAAVAVGSGAIVTNSVAASASASAPRPAAVIAVGTYNAAFGPGAATRLVIHQDTGGSTRFGTYTMTDFGGETGTWVTSGSTIALLGLNGSDIGVMFMGTLTATGISPGKYGLPTVVYSSWSATKTAAKHRVAGHGTGAVATGHARVERLRPAAKVAGSYTLILPDIQTAVTLTTATDTVSKNMGTFAFSTQQAVNGNWLLMGKQFAMGVTSSNSHGAVFIGTVNAKGISTRAKHGDYAQPPGGLVSRWYAETYT